METAATTQDNKPVALFKKRNVKSNLRKRPPTPPTAHSDSDSDYSQDEDGQKIKRRRKGGIDAASSVARKPINELDTLQTTKFTGDRSTTIQDTNDATKQSNWYDEDELLAKNLLGTTRKLDPAEPAEPNTDGTYKGMAGYSSFIQKNPNARQNAVGPVKAPTNIRTITVTDFAPDVCKDYKQTGFCGFGDSCKFLHAREDYKQGWALDRDWEVQTKGKKLKGTVVSSANRQADAEDDDEDAALLEKIPFACIICKQPYKYPVVTRCGHYYCESCALQRYKKNPSCAACGAGTNGVFNVAKNLQKILERKQKREDRLKEKEKEDNSDDDS
jgi:RING finger protein 113A